MSVKRRFAKVPLVVLLLAIVPMGYALAKGDPTLATIEGPGLGSIVEVGDPELLSLLNPWAGSFANWEDGLVPWPPDLADAYLVRVYAGLDEKTSAPDLVYLFYYSPRNEGESGVIYVPGEGEDGYVTNIATIWAGRDGEWHPASPDLDRGLRSLISGQPDGVFGLPPEPIPSSLVPAAAVLALGAATYLGRRLLRSAPRTR